MELTIKSKDKKLLIEDKTFIGTGLYKDSNGFVWNISKDNGDWLIKRTSSYIDRKSLRPETDKKYWSKVFTKEMVNTLFNRRVIAKKLVSMPDKNIIVADFQLIETEADRELDSVLTAYISKDDSNNYIVSIKNSNTEREIQLPEKISTILDSFEPTEASSILSDIILSASFSNFIIANLYGGI